MSAQRHFSLQAMLASVVIALEHLLAPFYSFCSFTPGLKRFRTKMQFWLSRSCYQSTELFSPFRFCRSPHVLARTRKGTKLVVKCDIWRKQFIALQTLSLALAFRTHLERTRRRNDDFVASLAFAFKAALQQAGGAFLLSPPIAARLATAFLFLVFRAKRLIALFAKSVEQHKVTVLSGLEMGSVA